ncbi:ABC transporter ATP-binding protein [Streptomyces sp. NPDC054962]
MTVRTQPADAQPDDQAAGSPPSAVLELDRITAGYHRATVLRDVSVAVPRGKVVALLGPNGAGKTTLLRTAAGTLRPQSGTVVVDGADMTRTAPHRRNRRGLCLVPEGRGIFPALTVRDNLRMFVPPWSADGSALERAISAFPDLGRRLGQIAGSMSGGQQQMLALSRAWLAQPRVVLLDEVSMGLAPRIVDEIFMSLRRLAAEGTALLIVEQYVNRALEIADHVCLLEKGKITFSGPPSALQQDALLSGYLGLEGKGGTG